MLSAPRALHQRRTESMSPHRRGLPLWLRTTIRAPETVHHADTHTTPDRPSPARSEAFAVLPCLLLQPGPGRAAPEAQARARLPSAARPLALSLTSLPPQVRGLMRERVGRLFGLRFSRGWRCGITLASLTAPMSSRSRIGAVSGGLSGGRSDGLCVRWSRAGRLVVGFREDVRMVRSFCGSPTRPAPPPSPRPA